MIDANILRSLGWSEELISEVLRSSKKLPRSLPETPTPTVELPLSGIGTGNELYPSPGQIGTSHRLAIEHRMKD